MTKDELVRVILMFHQDMKTLTLESGVDPNKYQSVLDILEEPVPNLQDLQEWLHEIRNGPYDNVLKVWERHKPETWAMYALYEVHDLAEQKLLRTNQSVLRKAWRDAPRAEKKPKSQQKGTPEGSESVCVRPPKAGADENYS